MSDRGEEKNPAWLPVLGWGMVVFLVLIVARTMIAAGDATTIGFGAGAIVLSGAWALCLRGRRRTALRLSSWPTFAALGAIAIVLAAARYAVLLNADESSVGWNMLLAYCAVFIPITAFSYLAVLFVRALLSWTSPDKAGDAGDSEKRPRHTRRMQLLLALLFWAMAAACCWILFDEGLVPALCAISVAAIASAATLTLLKPSERKKDPEAMLSRNRTGAIIAATVIVAILVMITASVWELVDRSEGHFDAGPWFLVALVAFLAYEAARNVKELYYKTRPKES